MNISLKNATVTHSVCDGAITTVVTVDALSAFKAIGNALGLNYAQADERDMRVHLGGLPEMPALELQQDISLHGSPCWDTIRILETDSKHIEEYLKFQEVLAIVKRRQKESTIG